MNGFKRPESVLVIVYTRTGKVLLMRRKDRPGFWQSVTGSMKWHEREPAVTACRELKEETGLNTDDGLRDWGKTYRFEIMPQWQHCYPPGTRENLEHLFSLELAEEAIVTLNPAEHVEYEWLSVSEAEKRATSWTNRDAIHLLRHAHEG
ncbi:MAG: dihydroneopterin triphosphate diphosphatase [Acidiferrobacterales bacterium]